MNACERSFAEGDSSGAILSLVEVMRELVRLDFGGPPALLLEECLARLLEFSSMRQEYVVLSLYAIHATLSVAVPVSRLAFGVTTLAPEGATRASGSISE